MLRVPERVGGEQEDVAMPHTPHEREGDLHDALDEAEARLEEAAEWLERAGAQGQRLAVPSEVMRHLIAIHGAVSETLRHLRDVRRQHQV